MPGESGITSYVLNAFELSKQQSQLWLMLVLKTEYTRNQRDLHTRKPSMFRDFLS